MSNVNLIGLIMNAIGAFCIAFGSTFAASNGNIKGAICAGIAVILKDIYSYTRNPSNAESGTTK